MELIRVSFVLIVGMEENRNMANIIIIGGGVAGLSAGIYAQLNGHNATIYERHFKAGGNLTGWDRGGYHIDNCIHWLTGTNPATKQYNMWQDFKDSRIFT